MKDKKEFLIKRINELDACITQLEITANNYFSVQDEVKGWNILLGARDKIKKLRDNDIKAVKKLLKRK